MKKNPRILRLFGRVLLATILFSILRMILSFIPFVDTFVEWGWSLTWIILVGTLIQLSTAGLAVLIVMPPILGFKSAKEWLPASLRLDRKLILAGILSFGIFCLLTAALSLGMGIFKGDLLTVFSTPDLRPDPDVIGWGYFLLALVPGIWEELAFRGLIQTKLRCKVSTNASVYLSAVSFALFHLTLLSSQGPEVVLPKVVMAFFYGIGWGYLTVRAGSVVPGIISHYLVDSFGQIFLGVESTAPALVTIFFVVQTMLFPVFNLLLAKLMYKGDDLRDGQSKQGQILVGP